MHNGISIDDIDLKILLHLYNIKNNEQVSTYEIAKKVFDDLDSDYKKQIRTNLVIQKLKRLSHYGLIEINNISNGGKTKKSFDLISEKINMRKIGFKSYGIDNYAMFLKINGDWNIFVRKFF